jgi:hypothetical protein
MIYCNTRDLAIFAIVILIHETAVFAIIVTNCISFYLYITLTDPLGLHNII